MQSDNAGFCPLIQGDCRRDCVWYSPIVELREDGVSEEPGCAVMDIAAGLMYSVDMIDGEGWMADD